MVAERLEYNRSEEDVLDELSRPAEPFAWTPGPLWRPLARVAAQPPTPGAYLPYVDAGLLPPAVREHLGLSWSARDERRLRRFGAVVRTLVPLLPERLRYLPVARAARRAVIQHATSARTGLFEPPKDQ